MQFKAIPKRKFLLLGGDILIILFSTFFAFLLRTGEVFNFLAVYTGATLICLLVFPLLFYVADLYNSEQKFRSIKGVAKIVTAIIAGAIFIPFLFYALPPYRYGRGIFIISIFILAPSIFFWRVIFKRYLKAVIKPKHVLLMGKDWVIETLYKALQRNPEYLVVGFINGETKVAGNPFPGTLEIFEMEDVETRIREKAVDGIVIDFMEERSQRLWQELLKFKISGINIIGALALYQELTGKIPIYHVNDQWFVYTPGYLLLRSSFVQKVKRLSDLGLSLLSLPIALPLMGLIALAIKLDSKGPVLYRQRRVGLEEEEFDLIKFRTMTHNAEKTTGVVWAEENDSRITRVGKVLRITRLDELPQLFNVLRDEMSFIGPRPERPEFVKKLEEKIPYYSLRHSVNPGITGWAQVNYPYGASVEDAIEKLQYDLFYVQNMSFLLELRIFLKTIQVVLFGNGSR